MEQLFYDYGYAFLIVAALIEGEILLLIAGSLAYYGFFQLPIVMLFAFIGAIIHDQLLYWVGYFGGAKLLERSTFIRKKSEKVFTLLKKHSTLLILGFRFIYGIRTVTPIIVGASGISQRRYAMLTVIAAAIWAVVISSLGYMFAEMVEHIEKKFQNGQQIAAALLGVVLVVAFGIYYIRKVRQRSASRSKPQPSTTPSLAKDSLHE